ncbi:MULTISPECIES: L-cystine transporter [Paenibacillus]|jgi:L-cystine uptake protein TcyP (sodium:dicarboxylate symporter family)|uniref:L-cystine uptake protein TcyP n=2 Tax=Paenibacillus TaxID=44249 RepID=A0ABX2ZDG0_PAEPO|nr:MULTISPECIES: L-cystine transporter [Paenibacillus]ALA41247.1 sodium:dicarboxylate symporter [Paenibacillus peoriae]APB72039.1 glutamate/aspartate:proton symporter GltP [Paenibacillus polymyxa]APB76972.1 glutamate/aspartate:proton symporter GltP [Paenibacillus polymyxa]APQ58528.1 sodium:dicarboxylate symporter [Paenibacillus polymyxa]MBP1175261.1 L-cystine uptake protein TcyP (sodium:dicarboxylate symporter family) [Paenibacillus sp. PvR133]
MDTFFIILNVIVLLLLLGVLVWMQKKHISFTKRVFAGLGFGLIYGAVLQYAYGAGSEVITKSVDWFNLAGNGYVRLLQMVVIPLIMVSIISAIMNLKGRQNLGKISVSIIAVLLITTAIAASVSIVTSLSFDLKAIEIQGGEKEQAQGLKMEERLGTVQDMTIPQQVLEFIPSNPFEDMTGARRTSTLAVVIFSAFIGVAVLGLDRKKPEQAQTFRKVIDAVYAVVMRIVTLVLRLTPYGILALITKVVATTNPDEILKLIKFVLASYVALLVMFIIHLILLALFGYNPVTYVKKVLPTLVFAFTSRSSAATIPLNVETQTKKLGVSDGIANLSATLGATIGQNGCAGIYPAMLAVMIAPTVGIDPTSWDFILTLILVVTVSSFGVAGVGGGATFASLIVLSTMNLPVALAGLLISVEPLIDMGRTALNVNDSITAGLISGKVLKENDQDVFNNHGMDLDATAHS